VYKRPERQNLWGRSKSVVVFVVKNSGIDAYRSEERRVSKVLAGSQVAYFVPKGITLPVGPMLKNCFGFYVEY